MSSGRLIIGYRTLCVSLTVLQAERFVWLCRGDSFSGETVFKLCSGVAGIFGAIKVGQQIRKTYRQVLEKVMVFFINFDDK